MADRPVILRDPVSGERLFPATLSSMIYNEDGSEVDLLSSDLSKASGILDPEHGGTGVSSLASLIETVRSNIIDIGSYTGNGATTKTLTFARKPKMVFIQSAYTGSAETCILFFMPSLLSSDTTLGTNTTYAFPAIVGSNVTMQSNSRAAYDDTTNTLYWKGNTAADTANKTKAIYNYVVLY